MPNPTNTPLYQHTQNAKKTIQFACLFVLLLLGLFLSAYLNSISPLLITILPLCFLSLICFSIRTTIDPLGKRLSIKYGTGLLNRTIALDDMVSCKKTLKPNFGGVAFGSTCIEFTLKNASRFHLITDDPDKLLEVLDSITNPVNKENP